MEKENIKKERVYKREARNRNKSRENACKKKGRKRKNFGGHGKWEIKKQIMKKKKLGRGI